MAGKRWTNKEDAVLIDQYSNAPMAKLRAKLQGRSDSAIWGRARVLGVSRSAEFLKLHASRLTGNEGVATRFKKGHKSHNKGKRFIAGGRSVETYFKPGQKPHNTVPLGTVTVRKDKRGNPYKFIKTERGMEPLHRHLMAQHLGGKLPSGAVVRFRDGDTLNCCLENLMLLDQRGNMQRNSVHRLPPELKKVTRVRALLTRKINQLENGKK